VNRRLLPESNQCGEREAENEGKRAAFFYAEGTLKAQAFALDNQPIKGKISREISGLTA